jgi:hypothetical protein
MEHAQQKTPAKFVVLDGKKTDFGAVWSNFVFLITNAIEIFKKEPVTFILAALIPLLLSWAFVVILVPLLMAVPALAPLLAIIALVLGIVLSIVSYLAVLKAVVDKAKGTSVNLGGLFGFGLAKAISFVILDIKVLLTIFTGLSKFVNAWLSPVYFIENGGKVDEAIKSSQASSDKKTATVVWGIIVSGIMISIGGSILTSIWTSVLGNVAYVGTVGSYIISGLITVFTILCHVVLKGEVEKAHGASAAPAHHA